jgi:hypothetical protein
VVPGDGTEVRGEIHINRGRVVEERGGKEMDGCPLTVSETLLMGQHPLQHASAPSPFPLI